MKYVPALMSLDGELNALSHQFFSDNVMPLIRIVKDIKKEKGKASIIDDIEELIKSKPDNDFFITVPRNLNLSHKKLKKPIEAFYKNINSNMNFHRDILIRFAKYPNVIPVMEVNLDNYKSGDLADLKKALSNISSRIAYMVEAKKLAAIEAELFNLIGKKDFLIYNLEAFSFEKASITREVKKIQSYQVQKGFKSIVIKQIYSELTFPKLPNRDIRINDVAYECIDFDYYDDFKNYFDYFGDMAGIRTNPIYSGGVSYPAYLTIEMDTFVHHGFRGTEKDPNSYGTELLVKYLKSDHWNSILSPKHKTSCNGCLIINNFNDRIENPNNPTKWKTVTISHFIDTMDYKISNSIV